MLAAFALLILRLVVGLTVAAHGAQKLFGWFEGPGLRGFHGMLQGMGVSPARPWAVTAALAELVGGLLVAVGFLTPIGALAVAGSMLVAIWLVHLPKGFFATKGGYEFPLLILAVMLAISLMGPGAIAIDSLIHFVLPPVAWLVFAILVVLGAAAAAVSSRVGIGRRELG